MDSGLSMYCIPESQLLIIMWGFLLLWPLDADVKVETLLKYVGKLPLTSWI